MKTKSLLILFIFIGLITPLFFTFAANNVSGNAWSDQEGYFNFGCANCNANVSDTIVNGFGWSSSYGWLNLSPDGGGAGGVKNDGKGNLSGYAWSSAKGWIDFTGVKIDSTGKFTGEANGTNGNTEKLNFDCTNCSVKTTWSPKINGGSSSGGGGGGGGLLTTNNGPDASQLKVLINNGSSYTNNTAVTLELYAGSDVKKMAISNTPGFENISQESYQATKNWTLISGDGQKTVYVKFYTESGEPSGTISASIILDTVSPSIKITNVKKIYNPAEDVIVGGTTSKGNVEITALIGGKSGVFTSDSNGQWLTTFGKMPVGDYYIKFTPKDLAGNTGITVSSDFSVQQSAPLSQTQPSILQNLKNAFGFLTPKNQNTQEQKPAPVITVPKEAPLALKNPSKDLPEDIVSKFVLAPLPEDIALLAQKFPELNKTFKDVGISKVTDVQKLRSAHLSLPGLAEEVGMQGVEISPGKFNVPENIPVANLSAEVKNRIPTNIVFAKAGGGLIDVNVGLSFTDNGKAQQKITTITGKSLELTVRVDNPAKNVTGYIVFRSQNSNTGPSAVKNSQNSLLASLSSATEPSVEANTVSTPEKMLVLSEFNYTDTGSGVYTATVQTPAVEGEYSVITVINYVDPKIAPKSMELIAVVDPEGYIYEENGNQETRIDGAIVSLYWLNPDTKKYELWQANKYQQINPQTTDVRGTYSFLVPDGYYYLTVDAPGYLSYKSAIFQATGGSGVHMNISMKATYWWTKVIDWKTILLVLAVLLLLYNFYRDKVREKNILKQKAV